MSKLHLIANPISLPQLIASISRFTSAGDKLLFIGNSVVSLLDKDCRPVFEQTTFSIYALLADINCRGIAAQTPPNIELVDDYTMVQLVEQSNQVISW